MNIGIEDLAQELQSTLQQCVDDVNRITNAAAVNAAKNTVKYLREGTFKDRTGKYRKSFTYRVSRKPHGTYATIYSGGGYHRLTHLLEKGHPTRDGTTHTRAFPHWTPAREKAAKDFAGELQRQIDKLGD